MSAEMSVLVRGGLYNPVGTENNTELSEPPIDLIEIGRLHDHLGLPTRDAVYRPVIGIPTSVLTQQEVPILVDPIIHNRPTDKGEQKAWRNQIWVIYSSLRDGGLSKYEACEQLGILDSSHRTTILRSISGREARDPRYRKSDEIKPTIQGVNNAWSTKFHEKTPESWKRAWRKQQFNACATLVEHGVDPSLLFGSEYNNSTQKRSFDRASDYRFRQHNLDAQLQEPLVLAELNRREVKHGKWDVLRALHRSRRFEEQIDSFVSDPTRFDRVTANLFRRVVAGLGEGATPGQKRKVARELLNELRDRQARPHSPTTVDLSRPRGRVREAYSALKSDFVTTRVLPAAILTLGLSTIAGLAIPIIVYQQEISKVLSK